MGCQVSTSLTGLQSRRRARAAESARLEIVCCESNRGFKSHRLRQMPHLPDKANEQLSDDDAMIMALAQARDALVHGDVPVGAVTLVDGRPVAARHNERQLTGD